MRTRRNFRTVLVAMAASLIVFSEAFFFAAASQGESEIISKELIEKANKGDVDAQFELAFIYLDQGNHSKAELWWGKSAKQGNVPALVNIARLYDEGIGVGEDDAKAMEWYKLAAELGNSIAQSRLGYFYSGGANELIKDDYEAVKWYQLAAKQGDLVAQTNMGLAYYSGLGVARNYTDAARWFELAAKQRGSEAQFMQAYMYDHGLGFSEDKKEAAKWYELAAEQGHVDAQINLAMAFSEGRGIPEDKEKAFKWFRSAVEHKHERQPILQINLGIYFYNGFGVEQNLIEAYKWFSLSALSGSEEGADYIEAVSNEMSPSEIERAMILAEECLTSNYERC